MKKNKLELIIFYKKKLSDFYKDFQYLSFYSKLIVFLPIAIVLGPLISDGIVTVTSIFFLYEIIKKKKNILNNKFFLIFLIYWFILIASSFAHYPLNSNDFLSSLTNSATTIRFGIFFIIVSHVCLEETKFIEVFKKILFITLLFVIIHALLIYFLRFDLLQPHNFHNFHFKNLFYRLDYLINSQAGSAITWTDHRISGVFYSEYVLGTYLLKIGFLFLSISFNKTENFKFTNLIFVIVLIFTIFITGDRSPAILSIIGLLVFLVVSNIRNFYRVLTFFILLSIILFSLITNPNLKDRFISQVTNYYKNSDSNIILFGQKIWWFSEGHAGHVNTALHIFEDHKILGSGVRTFRIKCREPKYLVAKYSCTSHPHNTYAELLSDTGIIGFLFILLFFIFVSFKILSNFYYRKIIINYDSKQLITILLFICLFPYITTGSFFNNVTSIYNYFILGFFIYTLKNSHNFFK